MELVRKNIHMDRIKSKAATQIVLEDDRNVPDQKPDMERIILQKGSVRTDEIKVAENRVNVSGKLVFQILYGTENGGISRMEGEIPFDEQINMEGVQNGDNVEVCTRLEDMGIDLVNSRKLSIHALAEASLWTEEVYDEEIAVEVYHDEPVETKKSMVPVTEISILKKDIMRFKEELEMPQSFPNIFEIIWDDVRVGGITFEAMNGQISANGEIAVFLLYEGEGEERPLKCYEKTIPFKETIECQGCMETMIPDITYHISHNEIEVRTDFDGEERVACLDLVLDLDMKLYEEEQIETLTDVYGVAKDVQPVMRQGTFSRLLVRTSGRTKLTEQVKLPAGLPDIAALCHSSAEAAIESTELTEQGVLITGTLTVEILYVPEGEAELSSFRTELPFAYELEAPDLKEACRYNIEPSVDQLNVSMLSGSEVDIKAVLAFGLLGFCDEEENIISDISVTETDMGVINELPGIVVYVAAEGDELWELGKKYYVPLSQIREMNRLCSDTLKAGEKILIVR